MAGHELGDLSPVQAPRKGRTHVDEAPELAARRSLEQELGGLERGGSLIGKGREQPEVLPVELVETELGQGDHADDLVVVAHRHDEHRLIDVVGPGDRGAARIAIGVVD